MGSKVGKILKIAAPIALAFVPGMQGFAVGLGTALGASGAAAAALGSGIIGAGVGGLTGGLKGAVTGGLTGGLGGYANAGGLSGALGGATKGAGGILWNAPGQAINWAAPGVNISGIGGGLSGMLSGAGRAIEKTLSGMAPGTGANTGNLLSTASNIYSGIQGTKVAKDMAAAQMAATDRSLALQSRVYDQTSANMNPFMTTGQAANTRLSGLLGLQGDTNAGDFGSLTKRFTLGDFTADPGYQFRLEQGTKAMNQSLGARGKLFSGEALKSAQDFGQGLADQTYNDAYTRYVNDQNNQFGRLNTTSAAGQNAAANLGTTGASYANQAGELNLTQGNIQANRINKSNDAINTGLAGLLDGGSSYQFGAGGQGNQLPIYDASGKIIGYRQA